MKFAIRRTRSSRLRAAAAAPATVVSAFTVPLLVMLAATPAEAHLLGDHGAGLAAGLVHPLFGLDHLLAMVAVGIWATQLGGRALWLVPASFAALVAVGGGMAMAVGGSPFPLLEPAIALSVLLLGGFILGALRPAPGLAVALVGLFAWFHGYAHGTELPAAASPGLYAAGFLLATACLHLCGVAVALALPRLAGAHAAAGGLRTGGALVAGAGALLLLGG